MPKSAEVHLPRASNTMFVISGKVTNRSISKGKVNLLQGMQKHAGVVGVTAAAGGQDGNVANAAMLAMYDGEDVQHVRFKLNDQWVGGTFENAGFHNDDDVKVIVSDVEGDTVFAHAVVRPSDGVLWMPHSISKGRWAIALYLAKLAGAMAIAGWMFMALLMLSISGVKGFLDDALIFAGVTLGVPVLLGVLTYRSSMHDGIYAEQIFGLLGFENPKVVNISPFCLRLQRHATLGGYDNVFLLAPALSAYKSCQRRSKTWFSRR